MLTCYEEFSQIFLQAVTLQLVHCRLATTLISVILIFTAAVRWAEVVIMSKSCVFVGAVLDAFRGAIKIENRENFGQCPN